MPRPIDDLVEPSSPEALLKQYREACERFSWEEEERSFLTKGGKTNIAMKCLEGTKDPPPSYRKAFDFVETADGDLRFSSMNYGDLESSVRRLVTGFRRGIGVETGEAVAIYLPNGREQALAILALSYMGAVASPIMDIYKVEPLKTRLGDLKPRVLITSRPMIEELDFQDLEFVKTLVFVEDENGASLPPALTQVRFSDLMDSRRGDPELVEPDHPLMIHYTPGTLGLPKGIVHGHRSAAGYCHTGRWVFRLDGSATMCCTAHPGWIMGSVYGIFAPLLCGAGSILCPGDPEGGRAMSKLRPTAVYTVPSFLGRLLSAGRHPVETVDLASVRIIASSGERLSPGLAQDVKSSLGLTVLDTWWMTETGMIMIANTPAAPVKPGSIGLAVPGIRAAVIDEKGSPLPPNSLGHLAIKGKWPAMLRGVWGREEADLSSYFLSDYFLTSDYAYCDEDDYFWFQGRGEEFIKRGGEKVSPVEIEDVLGRHPAVDEAAVIGIARGGGDRLVAYIVLSPGFEVSDELIASIQSWIRDAMGAFAVPDSVRFTAVLPKTRIGKVLKRELRAMEMESPDE